MNFQDYTKVCLSKITIASLFFVLSAIVVFGQKDLEPITKGHFFISPNWSIHSINERVSETDFVKTPPLKFSKVLAIKIGYFPINNLVAGLEINTTKNGYFDYKESIPEEDTSVGLGVFSRYYMYKGVFAEGYLGFFSKTIDAILPEEDMSAILKRRVSIGYSYFVFKHIAIEPMVNFSNKRYRFRGKDLSDDVVSPLSFGIALTFSF